MLRTDFLRLNIYIYLLLYCCFSTESVFAQYSDKEVYSNSDYGILLRKMNKDILYAERQDIEYVLDSLDHINKNNDQIRLYSKFAKYTIQAYYSTGPLKNIECDFHEILYESGKNHSIVSLLAIRIIIGYYRSVNQDDKLLDVLDFLKENPSYLERKDLYDFTSSIYYTTFQFNKAIETYKKSIEINKSLAYNASLLNNIGLAYMKLNEPDKASEHYKKAYSIVSGVINDSLRVNPEFKGLQYLKKIIKGNLNQAKEKNTIALEDKIKTLDVHIHDVLREENYLDVKVLFEKAQLVSQAGDYELSNQLLDSVEVNLKRHVEVPNLLSKIKKQKAYNNLKLGLVEAALENIKEDTVEYVNEQLHKNIHNYYNKSYLEEQKIIEEAIKLISEQKQTVLWFLCFVICISASIYILILKRKKRAENKTILTLQQLHQVKSESEMYFKESNHRIMNNIQLINDLTTLDYWDNESFDIDAFQNKMNSLADIHELLYKGDSYNSVSVKQYLENLVKYMSNVGTEDLSIHVEVAPKLYISPDQLKYIGLLTVELITNSLKHGLKTIKDKRITIEFKGDYKDNWTYMYTDNGIFNAEQFSKSGGYGNQLIFQLIDLLQASFKIMDSKYFNMVVTYKDKQNE